MPDLQLDVSRQVSQEWARLLIHGTCVHASMARVPALAGVGKTSSQVEALLSPRPRVAPREGYRSGARVQAAGLQVPRRTLAGEGVPHLPPRSAQARIDEEVSLWHM